MESLLATQILAADDGFLQWYHYVLVPLLIILIIVFFKVRNRQG